MLLVLWRVWFYFIAALPVVLLFAPLVLIMMFPNGYRIVFWIARNIWAPIVLYGMGFQVRKMGVFPKEEFPVMLVANHTSYIDVMVMLRMRKEPFVFVGKKELVKIPLFGYIFKRAAIMVDRSNAKSRYGVYRRAEIVIAKGYSVCIFPEKDYLDETVLLNPFKQGAFKLGIEHQLPIFPMVFLDCKRKFPWYTTHGYPGILRVKGLNLIDTQNLALDDIPKLQEQVYKQIKQELLDDPQQQAIKAISIWKTQSS